MKFFSPFISFLLHIGYFGPLLMGICDSSFLVLPFGNDLLVVGLVARHPHDIPLYVLSATLGSSIGIYLLSLASRRLGESGIRKVVGDSRYELLVKRIGNRSGLAVALAGLAPPPFPFTAVIAAVSALDYSLWKILLINFLARGTRFTILSILALKYGRHILRVAQSAPFQWSMFAFILLCLGASCFSLMHWLRTPQGRPAASHSDDSSDQAPSASA